MTLDELYAIIKYRQEKLPDNSYVASLFKDGSDRIVQKVGEEAVEVVIAAKNSDKHRLVEESADLLFHLLVLWVEAGVSLVEIETELEKRRR